MTVSVVDENKDLHAERVDSAGTKHYGRALRTTVKGT